MEIFQLKENYKGIVFNKNIICKINNFKQGSRVYRRGGKNWPVFFKGIYKILLLKDNEFLVKTITNIRLNEFMELLGITYPEIIFANVDPYNIFLNDSRCRFTMTIQRIYKNKLYLAARKK